MKQFENADHVDAPIPKSITTKKKTLEKTSIPWHPEVNNVAKTLWLKIIPWKKKLKDWHPLLWAPNTYIIKNNKEQIVWNIKVPLYPGESLENSFTEWIIKEYNLNSKERTTLKNKKDTDDAWTEYPINVKQWNTKIWTFSIIKTRDNDRGKKMQMSKQFLEFIAWKSIQKVKSKNTHEYHRWFIPPTPEHLQKIVINQIKLTWKEIWKKIKDNTRKPIRSGNNKWYILNKWWIMQLSRNGNIILRQKREQSLHIKLINKGIKEQNKELFKIDNILTKINENI